MDTLSVDVWQYIFKLACTDGGRTGAALSRTNKVFRSVSAPYRFYTVKLTRLKQIEAFLTTYEAAITTASQTTPPSDAPHVRHLFLAFLPGQTDVIVLGHAFHFMDFHGWQEDKDAWNERFVRILTRLFVHLAPSLHTLAVLQNYQVRLPYVRIEGGFPALRELTLLGDDRMFFRAKLDPDTWLEPGDRQFYSAGPPPDRDALAAAPLFPVLERLHLVDGDWHDTLHLWAVVVPRVVHLCVDDAKDQTCEALRDLLVDSSNLAALRTLAVSPKPQGGVPWTATAWAQVERASVDVRIVPAETMTQRKDLETYWPRRLEEQWQEHVSAGDP